MSYHPAFDEPFINLPDLEEMREEARKKSGRRRSTAEVQHEQTAPRPKLQPELDIFEDDASKRR